MKGIEFTRRSGGRSKVAILESNGTMRDGTPASVLEASEANDLAVEPTVHAVAALAVAHMRLLARVEAIEAARKSGSVKVPTVKREKSQV